MVDTIITHNSQYLPTENPPALSRKDVEHDQVYVMLVLVSLALHWLVHQGVDRFHDSRCVG